MVETPQGTQTRRTKWGWGILLVVAALFALNGVFWLFFGPDASVSNMAENTGQTDALLESTYPDAVEAIMQEARRVAIYLASIGTMGLVAALSGFRGQARFARCLIWVLIATMVALFLVGLVGGLGPFGAGMLILAVTAVVGQLLAKPT
jgi:hypothetical protein